MARAGVAVVLCACALGTACAGCATPPAAVVVPLPSADSPRQAFLRLPGPHGAADVGVLADNDVAWVARWSLMAQARRIDLGSFIFDGDVFGRALLGRLLERAAAGAVVRLLVDGRGSFDLLRTEEGRDDLDELAGVGVAVRVYNPPWRSLAAGLLGLDAVPVSAGSHNKILVIDDEVAVVGGRNVTALSFVAWPEHPAAVQDADVVVRGRDVVAAIAAVLDRDFRSRSNDLVTADRWNLRSPRDELVLLAHAMDVWLAGAVAREDNEVAAVEALLRAAHTHLGHAAVPAPNARVRDALRSLVRCRSVWGVLALPRDGGLPADVAVVATNVATDVAEVAVVSVPSRAQRGQADENPTLQAWLLALAGARRSVVIESPSFIVGPAFLLALQAASARGVDITVLTNSPCSSDSRIPQALFVDSWPELLARVPRLRLFVAPAPPMQHGKRAIFDDALAFTGTFNVDPFSTQMNSETIIATWSPRVAARIHDELAARRTRMLEYRIARRSDGTARRHPSGTPRAGEVVVEFGPRDHIGADELARIARIKALLLSVRNGYDFDVVVW
jgi:phosphatidylserine/phosphatidylglycerophosphate/cardiolipin synthase-like enzyme